MHEEQSQARPSVTKHDVQEGLIRICNLGHLREVSTVLFIKSANIVYFPKVSWIMSGYDCIAPHGSV